MEFIILGFHTKTEAEYLLFILFSCLYILTISSNTVIIILVRTDLHLHSPMYFYISNLSFLEISYISSTVPKVMVSLITGFKSISFIGCISQCYFFSCLGATENVLLTVMAYDHYLAFCSPLKYAILMNPRMCIQLAFVSWFIGFSTVAVPILSVAKSCFCGPNIVDHFFCEATPLLQLSCTDVSTPKFLLSLSASTLTLGSIFLNMVSYSFIIHTVLKTPTTTGRRKAFSTCVVVFFYTTVCLMYVNPSGANTSRNKVVSVIYGIITPLLNPFVYSLRNKEMKTAFIKMLKRLSYA